MIVEVGEPGTIAEFISAVVPGGKITSIGFLGAEKTGIDFLALFGSGVTFRHISVGSREGLQEQTHN